MRLTSEVLKRMDRIGVMVEQLLRATRTPGAAIAVVLGGETVFSGGYGYRDLGAKLGLNSKTIYPIASTTKSINATLLSMLVEAGLLAWDAPVQRYLPEFHLGDPHISARVTIRDLVAMRTGLARHDWLWMERPIDRADLVRRLAFLECSSGFREQFQYNNLTVTASGHVAEVVTGRKWEDLVCDKIIKPLGMKSTGFTLPESDNVSLSYHENNRREIVLTHHLESEVTAPAGGSMHSTVEDMARWLIFNLSDGQVSGRRLLPPGTIKTLQSSCVFAGADSASPSPNAAYALGWFVDTYKDHARISHGGHLRDVQSSMMLFPDDDLGMVSFANFGGPQLAPLMNQFAFNLLMGIDQVETIEEKLESYERRVDEIRARNANIRRVANTLPSHRLEDYAGNYEHTGYGRIEISCSAQGLSLRRHEWALPLEHWHYDTWIARESDAFGIASSHVFGPASPLVFEASAAGDIACLSVSLEPAVAAIRFSKTSVTHSGPFSLHQALSFPTTDELVAAHQGNRIAWVFDEQGVRNIWVAEGPAWSARRITQFTSDDGQELGQLAFTEDGSQLIFVRNHSNDNWVSAASPSPNPLSLPVAQRRQICAVAFDAISANETRELAEGNAPAVSPDGQRVAFLRGGQVYIVGISEHPGAARALFFARGTTDTLVWSPDGSRLAFISQRGPLSLLGVFHSEGTPLVWMAPSANHVTSPRWSSDGKRIAFVKMPGTGGPIPAELDRHSVPFELWVADASTGKGHMVYRSPRSVLSTYPDAAGELALAWGADDRLVFRAQLADGWLHVYSVHVNERELTLLTPGSYMVVDLVLSLDQRTVVFSANTGDDPDDDDRRHLFRVEVDRPGPMPLTAGRGIECKPVIIADGKNVAFIGSTAQRSPLPVLVSLEDGHQQLIGAEQVPQDFPGPQFLVPRKVVFRAADGLIIHGQLFDDRVNRSGLRPAAIYVHGGPCRQMLLGFHHIPYYARHYSEMQYLASRGLVVLSLNYRLGTGYGDSFQNPPAGGTRGASEYLDVLAAREYLASLPMIDAKRIGIWGGSYGGYLTALALARDSDLFACGVDVNGVHSWLKAGFLSGTSNKYVRPPDYLQALDTAWRASPIADYTHWRSPVLFIHGDDDRNVDIAQTVDMIEYLRSLGVRFEQLIIPDETHNWNLFRTWLTVTGSTTEFLLRELGPMPQELR